MSVATTPKPWRIEVFSRHGDLSSKTIIGSDGQGFASTVGLTEPLDTANANLLLAAPELYDALQALLGEVQDEKLDCVKQAKRAIAMAEGRA